MTFNQLVPKMNVILLVMDIFLTKFDYQKV